MNIVYKLQDTSQFTISEKYIAEYILAHNISILKMSTTVLGNETYTSPATIVRFCKKLGFDGFDDFKIKFAQDYNKNILNTNSIDYNYPFSKQSTTLDVINSISSIESTTINDVKYMIDEKQIDSVIDYIANAEFVDFYGYGTSILAAYDFEFHMSRLNKNVRVQRNVDSSLNNALRSTNNHLAFIISYSGETDALIEIAELLRMNKTPIISITSNTENRLKLLSSFNLPIVTKESLYSKIGSFSSSTSVRLLLDIIYSCYYQKDYDNKTKYILDNARKIEKRNNKQINF